MLCKILFTQKEDPGFPTGVINLSTAQKWQILFTLLAGKIVGVLIVIGAMKGLPAMIATPAFAAERVTGHERLLVNTANTIWTLIGAFLVFAMQAGFVMLKAGFARQRETVNILMESVLDTCLCGILFWAFGYAFMFSTGNGLIGYHWFFLADAPETYRATGIPTLAHWVFQFAFAGICTTIVSGAMIGRTSFRGNMIYTIGITGFIYPILGHWMWGPDGFLAPGTAWRVFASLGTGFRDFAGSTVVHTIGGVASLAGALVLGPRLTRQFKRDGGGMPPAHNLTLAAVGGFVLWFGWFGYTAGSTLSAVDMQGIGRISINTTLAAFAGGLSAMYTALWLRVTKGKFDARYLMNGFLGGLVAISCPCYWVSPLGAIVVGMVAGILVLVVTNLLEHGRIDDPVGVVPVHAACGLWGTISLGFFATGQFGFPGADGANNLAPVSGLFYGGGTAVLKAQLIGSLIVSVVTFAGAFALMYLIQRLRYPWKLRVEPEGEITGPDVFQHGVEAYAMPAGSVSHDLFLSNKTVS